jgi:multiple sugar transport system permease protein
VRLILPLSRPALATVAIFSFLASWDEFVWALTVINDPNKRTLPIAIALFQGEHSTSWGLVFAASAIAILPVIGIFVIFQRQFVSGLASGALKA